MGSNKLIELLEQKSSISLIKLISLFKLISFFNLISYKNVSLPLQELRHLAGRRPLQRAHAELPDVQQPGAGALRRLRHQGHRVLEFSLACTANKAFGRVETLFLQGRIISFQTKRFLSEQELISLTM